MPQLIPLMVLIPLIAAALTVIFGRQPRLQVAISSTALTATVAISAVQLWLIDLGGPAVVAVGGYGRGTLAPGSDIDLLFLLPAGQTPRGGEVVETMLAFVVRGLVPSRKDTDDAERI